MIERFYLRDFLSFKEVELEFKKGLVVFTGPSGSGKSILMNSILASLGIGDAQAGISEATVNVSLNLEEAGIEADDVTVFKQMKKEKVRYFINNQTISKKMLSRLSSSFVRHLSLRDYSDFKNENLLDMIDEFSSQDNAQHLKKIAKYRKDFLRLGEITKELTLLEEQKKKVLELREYTRFEIDKIDLVSPKKGEYEELIELKKELSKREKVEESIQKAEEIFAYENSVLKALELLEIQSSFFDDTMNELRAHFELSTERICELEDLDIEHILTRIEQLSELKHRYGTIEDAILYKEQKLKELEHYESLDEQRDFLIKEISRLTKELRIQADEISLVRKKALVKIEDSFNQFLKQLYLRAATIRLEEDDLGIYGKDKVEIELDGTHLQKVSSGEFNRLRLALLAVKSINGSEGGVLMLDEIDANLSGEESMSVAKVLSHLAKEYQIFVISHQPQLTSQADQHFFVSKDEHSSVEILEDEQRVYEIARMVSGDEIPKEAIEFARGLL